MAGIKEESDQRYDRRIVYGAEQRLIVIMNQEVDMSTVLKKSPITSKSGRKISIAKKNLTSKSLVKNGVIDEQDFEMDTRVSSAVAMAVRKAKIMEAPVARYDSEKKIAYLEYADGRREVVE